MAKKEIEKQNHDYCNETLKLKGGIEGSFIELGKRLRTIRDQKKFAPYWESFDGYLDDMRMSKGTASKLINIYERFVLQYQIPIPELAAIGWSPLSEILPVVQNKTDAVRWVKVAADNPLRELRDEIREHKTGVEMRHCKHKNVIIIEVCKDCKQRTVHDK